MKKKLGSFRILKLNSAKLKRKSYKLDVSMGDAVRNNELIKLGENELLYAVQRLLGKTVNFARVDEIEKEKKSISKKRNSNSNREALAQLNKELNTLTFVPEVVAIVFSDKRHYTNILVQGLYINGSEYVRLLSGAGNIRRNTVFFIDKSMYDDIMKILDNGRDVVQKLNPAKFSAYLGLYASSGHRVSTPSFAVIPDFEFKRMADVTWIGSEDNISDRGMEIVLNPFDGQGLISPYLSGLWADELGLDYTPSTFMFRAPFAKGQVATFDFQLFASERGCEFSTDVWGDSFRIEDVDLVLSESQFKLWDSYNNIHKYLIAMKDRELSFRVSRYSPVELKSDTSSNYMYLQVLNLSDDDITSLASDTISYLRDIQVSDYMKSALYLSGTSAFPDDFSSENFADLDPISKAILLYPEILGERYVSQRISGTLEKKKKQAMLGKLILEGCYIPMVSDPYAQAQLLCGRGVTGLLKNDEHYCDYWSKRDVGVVGMARSPLTHNSEMLSAKIVSGGKSDRWYQYLDTAIVFPFGNLDTLYMADADFDGDLAFTTSKEEFINCSDKSLPISYHHKKAEKVVLTRDNISESDINGFNAKIGFITNVSSTLHAKRYDFPEGSKERIEIDRRLAVSRLLQGSEIDGAKHGGTKRAIPSEWTKYNVDMSRLDKALVAEQRPYFTRYLYDSYDKKYRDEIDKYNKYCWSHFSKSFDEVLNSDSRTSDEDAVIEKYFKYSFFLFSDSPMNRICKHVETEIEKINSDVLVKNSKFDYTSILSKYSFSPNKEKLEMLRVLFEKYNSARKALRNLTYDQNIRKDIYHIVSEIGNDAREKISSNSEELGNLVISLIMKDSRARSFAWTVFGDEIAENIMLRHGRQIDVLVSNDYGDVEFLYQNFSVKRLIV